MFTAICRKRKKCKECDVSDGDMNRMDCGCVFDKEIGEYETRNGARMAAVAKATKRGTWDGSRSTGFWAVEDANGETVDCGEITRSKCNA